MCVCVCSLPVGLYHFKAIYFLCSFQTMPSDIVSPLSLLSYLSQNGSLSISLPHPSVCLSLTHLFFMAPAL